MKNSGKGTIEDQITSFQGRSSFHKCKIGVGSFRKATVSDTVSLVQNVPEALGNCHKMEFPF